VECRGPVEEKYGLNRLHYRSAHVNDGAGVTLTINLAAQVCERGAHYFHLSLVIPFQLRGQELSAAQLATMGARFEEFDIRRVVAQTTGAPAPTV
jgi:CRISPR-associated protein Csx16